VSKASFLRKRERKRTVMASKSLNKRREDTELNKLVVENLSLGRFVAVEDGCVAIGKLATNGAVLFASSRLSTQVEAEAQERERTRMATVAERARTIRACCTMLARMYVMVP
jgi:hypothetical protein